MPTVTLRSPARLSTSSRVHASPPRETTSCAGSWSTACPHRVLRLELRPLAQRRLLPAAPPRVEVARALRAVLRHGGGERDLLPSSQAQLGGALGGAVATGIRLCDQGVALPDAHQAAERPRTRARALLRVHRAAARLAEARPDPLAAAAELQARRRAARGRPRAPAEAATPLLRVSRRELVPRRRLCVAARARCRARDRRSPGGALVPVARADRRLHVRALPLGHARAAWELQRVGARGVGPAVRGLVAACHDLGVLQQ